MQRVVFCVWLFSLCRMFAEIHSDCCPWQQLASLTAACYCMYLQYVKCPSIFGLLTNTAVIILVLAQIHRHFCCVCALGSWGMRVVHIHRYYQTISQSSCIRSHTHGKCRSLPVAPCPHSVLVLSVFVILANWWVCRGGYILVLCRISLTANEGRHFSFVCSPFGSAC